MKSKLDEKGRISIPRAIQKNLNLAPGDSLAIEMTASGILLKPLPGETRSESESIIVLNKRYFTVK